MKKISFLILGIVVFVLFRKFFIPGPLVFGDAPYFYKEGFKELVNVPSMWTTRGVSLGGANLFIWIYPLMVIYGILGTYLHLSNDSILRILFYLPSLSFACIGIYLLVRQMKFSTIVSFFAILIYIVNTYFLLLVDGGQVGVVLAYGFFPLALYLMFRYCEETSILNFLVALIASFLLTIFDFRIAAICILTAFLFQILLRKKILPLILVSLSLFGLSLFWIFPEVLLNTSISTSVSSLKTTSLLNTLLLSSSNWPTNQFGKSIQPMFYFFLVPVFIFIPLFFIKKRQIVYLTVLFLIFAFLAKGESDPFGSLYSFLIANKFGSVFRDSTKFFIPLSLIVGILVGQSVEFIKDKFKTRLVAPVVFIYFIFIVWQAFAGQLNGVLGKSPNLNDYQKIYSFIAHQDGFVRDIWFNAKSPFAYHTEEKQALDGQDLVNFRPFASMNVGTGDRFNFINNSEYLDLFKLLGIKYLIFNGNPRASFNKSDLEDWNRLMGLINNDKRLEKLNIGTNIPVYENKDILPNKFFVEKTFVVIGGDDIYDRFKKLDSNFSVANQGFLFVEDGKFDPSTLQNIASTSAVLVFNNKNESDLKMSFLQKDFINTNNFISSGWANRTSEDSLKWKFELLENKIDTREFDYNLGVAFSTQKNEKIKLKINIPEDGNYYINFRGISSNLKVIIDGQEDKTKVFSGAATSFEWFELGHISLTKGVHYLVFENEGGVQVLNTVSIASDDEMKIANQLIQNFLGYFQIYYLDKPQGLLNILSTSKWESLEASTTKVGWIVFADSYNPNWMLHKGVEDKISLPFYSAINGFYTDPSWGQTKIVFKGDEYLRWGVYFSGLTLLLIIIIVLWKLAK